MVDKDVLPLQSKNSQHGQKYQSWFGSPTPIITIVTKTTLENIESNINKRRVDTNWNIIALIDSTMKRDLYRSYFRDGWTNKVVCIGRQEP